MPGVDLKRLTPRILTKLNQWTLQRPGDPFEFEDWRVFEQWFLLEVLKYLEVDSHLVVIEHLSFAGLPWHVAAGCHLTCSYTSSWNTLFALHREPEPPQFKEDIIGVACVPTFDDGSELISAFHDAASRIEKQISDKGLSFVSAIDRDCDHKEFRRLLEKCGTLVVFCHGYFSPEEGESALMVAYEGHLPLKLPQAAASAQGRAHRFSWKNLSEVKRTPKIVISAACSSLRGQIAGQGERLGLYSSLSDRGTRSLIAPAWDIEAQPVLPIIESVLEKLLAGISVSIALKDACRDAENTKRVPRWLAWSLSVEGEW